MNDADLGPVFRVYRPAVLHIWIWASLAIAPLALIGLALLFSISSPDPLTEIRNMGLCLGVLGLLMLVLSAVMVSDLRKWKNHRSVRLTLCSNGFTFESLGNKAVCLWSEVQDVRYKQIRSTSRAFPGRSIRVINSIVKNDGTAFVLPEVLPLAVITDAVDRLRKSSQPN